eukprot:5103131-Amphidinium_carterae.1
MVCTRSWTSSSTTTVWRHYNFSTDNGQSLNYEIGSVKAVSYNGYNGYNGPIVIDTGAAVHVCPTTFCEHIEIKTMPESARRQFMTVTGEGLTISGWKEVTLVIGHMTMQIRFIVANVRSALFGLPDIDENHVTVHTGKQPY